MIIKAAGVGENACTLPVTFILQVRVSLADQAQAKALEFGQALGEFLGRGTGKGDAVADVIDRVVVATGRHGRRVRPPVDQAVPDQGDHLTVGCRMRPSLVAEALEAREHRQAFDYFARQDAHRHVIGDWLGRVNVPVRCAVDVPGRCLGGLHLAPFANGSAILQA